MIYFIASTIAAMATLLWVTFKCRVADDDVLSFLIFPMLAFLFWPLLVLVAFAYGCHKINRRFQPAPPPRDPDDYI